jgi:hypothetical protein
MQFVHAELIAKGKIFRLRVGLWVIVGYAVLAKSTHRCS